jgi:hypothetical protein
MKKKVLAVLISTLLCVSFASCGSKSASYESAASTSSFYANDAMGDYAYAEEAMENGFYEESKDATGETGDMSSDTTEVKPDSKRKLIKDYDLDIETEDFDGFMDMIQRRVNAMNGYIESLNTYSGRGYYYDRRTSDLTVRIPADKGDEFLDILGENSNIIRNSLNVNDVTLQYVDLESRKSAYKTEEARLLELLEKADTIEDILTIENRLSEIRYQLESMEQKLRTYDNLVDYSTFRLSVSEVKEYTEPEPESYLDRLTDSFTGGIKGAVNWLKEFSIWFVGAIPALILTAIVIFAVVRILIAANKRNQKKLLKKAAKEKELKAEATKDNKEENNGKQ